MAKTEQKYESEFGKGLTYCLALFLAHEAKYTLQGIYMKGVDDGTIAKIWFNGASDHLDELQTDRIKDRALRKRVESFRGKVLDFGHGIPPIPATKHDVELALAEARAILLEIDSKELGVETCKGMFE